MTMNLTSSVSQCRIFVWAGVVVPELITRWPRRDLFLDTNSRLMPVLLTTSLYRTPFPHHEGHQLLISTFLSEEARVNGDVLLLWKGRHIA